MKPAELFRASIKFKLMVAVFLFTLLAGIAGIYLVYRQDMVEVNDEAMKDFTIMADILENDMDRWLTNRQNDIEVMAANPIIQQNIS